MFLKLILLIALSVVLQQHGAEAEDKKKVVCYVGTWATYRQGNGKFDSETIDPFICTHVVYTFIGIQTDGSIRYTDPWLDLEDDGGLGNIKRFNNLKEKNPELKTIAAVGGWNEGSEKFSIVANNATLRQTFVDEATKLLLKFKFNGLDLDWEYPNKRHNLANDDKANFVALLKELSEAFKPYGFILSAAVSAVEDSVLISYDVIGVTTYVNFLNIMAYDLRGPWDSVTGYNAPFLAGPQDVTPVEKQLNIKAIVEYWLSQGAPAEKLVLGLPLYGHTFKLANASDHGVGSPSLGPGIAGQYSGEAGSIGYNELCEKMLTEPWTAVWDKVQRAPYAYINTTWVSYDNEESITLKTKYAVEKKLGGVMVWSLETDDFRGLCGPKYGLMKAINGALTANPKKTIGSMIQDAFKKVNDFFSGIFKKH